MRILLTGAHGFLGAHVRQELVRAGHEVTDAPGSGRFDVTTEPADAVAGLVRDALGPASGSGVAVVNCAGAVGGDPAALWPANVGLPMALAAACAAVAPGARFVHLGSAAEYGPLPAGTAAREDGATHPAGAYGQSKLAGTRAVLSAASIDPIVLRVFNPVGGGQSTATLPGAVAAAVHREPPGGTIRTGRLDAVRDFVSAADVARAVALAVAVDPPPDPAGRLLNIAGGRAVPVRELIRAVVRAGGRDQSLLEDDPGEGRSTGVDRSLADVSAARRWLGWSPAPDLDDAVRDLLGAVLCR